jgi:acetyltransferase-like isoleucine patch superfamily enzyme
MTKPVIGDRCTIGHYTHIEDDVVIGDDVTIESYCHIGYPTPRAAGEKLVIGADSLIRSHSVLYQGSTLGRGTQTGHHVTVREHTVAGDGWHLGTLCDIQGEVKIGKYVHMHSNVHVGQKAVIGDFVWIFPYTVLTNDPHPPSEGFLDGVTVEDYAVIATMCCILPGVRVGTRSLVGAQSLVSNDVPPDTVVAGVPAQERGPTSRVKLRDATSAPAYPWMRHFHRGYPPDVVADWKATYGV